MRYGDTLRRLWTSGSGKAGIVLLVVFTLVSLFVVLTYPADFGRNRWANPALWADNPKVAPPVWTNLLTAKRRAMHSVTLLEAPSVVDTGGRYPVKRFHFPLNHRADEAPSFVSMSVSNVTFGRRPPVLTVSLRRPDGAEITLHRDTVSGPRRGEDGPYARHDEEPLRLALGATDRSAEQLRDLFAERYATEISLDEIMTAGEDALFSRPNDAGDLKILKGEYQLSLAALVSSEDDELGAVKAVFGGTVFGAMGTDALGRDLAEGLLFGVPVALLIGIAASTVTTLIGTALGLTSGYLGGRADIAIQRAADIVANVPVLPLLIFLVFIGGSQLWLILVVLVAFSWPGLTIMIRSMVLQLREGAEVEAAKALGATSFRVIFRHVLPHTASYVLAQLVFFAPSAILAEAGLSFLGLGDPSVPTWGQILENGFRTGAVFLGYWWWVIPPGLLIVLTAVTFMFLALGLESVVDPRLRGRRSWQS